MRVVNLTSHEVRLLDGDALVVSWPASGVVARLRETTAPLPGIVVGECEVPRVLTSYEAEIDGLPEPQPGVRYLVSRVLAAASPRSDLSFPWGEVRDEAGQIVGCRALGQFVDVEGPDA